MAKSNSTAPTAGELSNLCTKLVEAKGALEHAVGNNGMNIVDVCSVVADVLQIRIDELDAIVGRLDAIQEEDQAGEAPATDTDSADSKTGDELREAASALNRILQVIHAIAEDSIDDTVAAAELIEDVVFAQYKKIDELSVKVV